MKIATKRKIRQTLSALSVTIGSVGGGAIGVGVGMLSQHHHPILGPSLIGFGAAMVSAYAVGLFLTSPRRYK